MRDLLTIKSLGDYWLADNIIKEDINFSTIKRVLEIKDTLSKFPIDNYVILDDMKDLKNHFPDNTVITNDYISISDMDKCIKILKK